MSETPPSPDPGQEQYAYAVTRRLFKFTVVGTVLFSATIVVLWYIM